MVRLLKPVNATRHLGEGRLDSSPFRGRVSAFVVSLTFFVSGFAPAGETLAGSPPFASRVGPATPEPSAAEVERARELAENGRQLFREASWDDAIAAFEAAYDLVRDPNLLYNVSLAHERAGRYAKAAEVLDRYRIVAPASERERLAAKSAELRAKAAELESTTAGDGSGDAKGDDSGDGTEGSGDPTDGAGQATEGGTGDATDGTPDEGSKLVAEGTERPSSETQDDAKRRIVSPAAWTLVGISAAGLGVGIGLGVGAQSLRRELDEDCVAHGSGQLCSEDSESTLQRARMRALGADLSFAVAGASAVGAAVLIALRARKLRSEDRNARRLEWTPSFDRGGGGVRIRGRF